MGHGIIQRSWLADRTFQSSKGAPPPVSLARTIASGPSVDVRSRKSWVCAGMRLDKISAVHPLWARLFFWASVPFVICSKPLMAQFARSMKTWTRSTIDGHPSVGADPYVGKHDTQGTLSELHHRYTHKHTKECPDCEDKQPLAVCGND